MDMLSENLVTSTIEEARSQAARPSKRKHTVESQEEVAETTPWQSLKDFARQVWTGRRAVDEVLYSEENLYHAERLGMTPQDLHRLIEKSRLYERIAQGGALAEAETMSQKLREGR